MSTTVFETNNSIYMLTVFKSDLFGNSAELTLLHGTDTPGIEQMNPVSVDSFEEPVAGRSFRAYLYMSDSDSIELFVTTPVKTVISK